jgi:hypothetical protein
MVRSAAAKQSGLFAPMSLRRVSNMKVRTRAALAFETRAQRLRRERQLRTRAPQAEGGTGSVAFAQIDRDAL